MAESILDKLRLSEEQSVEQRRNTRVQDAWLRAEILPGIHRVQGYEGAYLLRRELDDGVEFATLTLFDSMDAVRAFAGDAFHAAVVPPQARRVLSRFDET